MYLFSYFAVTVCDRLLSSSKKLLFGYELLSNCFGLHSFIRLADYLIVNTTHMLVVNSISKLLSVFQEHITHTPSLTLIQSWAGGETSLDPDVKVSRLV